MTGRLRITGNLRRASYRGLQRTVMNPRVLFVFSELPPFEQCYWVWFCCYRSAVSTAAGVLSITFCKTNAGPCGLRSPRSQWCRDGHRKTEAGGELFLGHCNTSGQSFSAENFLERLKNRLVTLFKSAKKLNCVSISHPGNKITNKSLSLRILF